MGNARHMSVGSERVEFPSVDGKTGNDEGPGGIGRSQEGVFFVRSRWLLVGIVFRDKERGVDLKDVVVEIRLPFLHLLGRDEGLVLVCLHTENGTPRLEAKRTLS